MLLQVQLEITVIYLILLSLDCIIFSKKDAFSIASTAKRTEYLFTRFVFLGQILYNLVEKYKI